MRRIGLIGGMSWESSSEYYRLVNRAVQDRLGGVHSADIAMISLDFSPVAEAQRRDDWDALGDMMIAAIGQLESAGAATILICSNTMHRLYDHVAAETSLPLIHIGDCVGEAARPHGWTRLGLLGTRFTMEGSIYRARLAERFGIECVLPNQAGRGEIDRIIYEELVRGVFSEQSRAVYRDVMADLAGQGCDSIILGCTEIPLLVNADDASVPLLDTTRLHAMAAVDFALSGTG